MCLRLFIPLGLGLLSATLNAAPAAEFQSYWHQSQAELTRYALTQSHYGEQHAGDAVLIFVTEPFSRSQQVKLDDWAGAGNDRVDVLKLNFIKQFLTGIYPYSLMLSVFTPTPAAGGNPRTLKTTMSGQEWCGHAFTQLNLRNGRYLLRGFSYFESEGDEQRTVPAALLEDELWTRLRIDPSTLPTGEFPVIPGSFASRLLHQRIAVRTARGAFIEPDATGIGERFGKTTLRAYRLGYADGDHRELTIYFEPDFPHRIAGWDEVWGSGQPGGLSETRATRTATLLTPYWRQHDNHDRALRKQLDLPTDR